MRRVATVAAWSAVLLVLATVGLYLALLAQRHLTPPMVPIDANNELAGYVTGDAVLLRHVEAAQIQEQQILAVRHRHRNLVGRVTSMSIDGAHRRFVVIGASRSGPITVRGDDVIGRVDHHVPVIGWVLLAARQRAVQILAGLAVVAIGVLVALGRRVPLSVLEEPEPLALPRAPAGATDASVAYVERPMSITPEDLRHVRFAQMRKGYDTEAVDDTLDKAAESLEVLLRERQQLLDRLRATEAEVTKYRALADAQSPATDELLHETRALRSLLQRVLGQVGQPPPPGGTPS